ncbi:MAG TPA: transglutaminaseTgpA domain-containing protein, partial [Gemmata sp.]|nr:transglutaminaseTgpA domain-containing protein [Gemmata sp.]
FRASTYLTFALACVCIWYAEWDILPEIGLVAGGAIVALVVLFRLETRVELLSIPAASRLGVILGLSSILWGTGRLLWERQNNKLQNVTWVLMGVMMFGLVLISLMPAKLARREKHAGDYWFLHGIALVIVIVAGAIAEDAICFTLIFLYAGTAVWSLSLFHMRQAGGAILPAPGERSPLPIGSVITTGGRQLGIRRTIGILAFTSLLAVPLYLITPRSKEPKLTFDQSRIEIGFNADQMTDLNQTGDLKSNDAVAFEVEAEVEGQPETILSPNQRWRGRILRHYLSGIWRQDISDSAFPGIPPNRINNRPWPPKLGAGQLKFTFSVPSKLQSDFLADPLVWGENQDIPVALLRPNGTLTKWSWGSDGPYHYRDQSKQESDAEPRRYVQVWHPEKDPDLGSPFELHSSYNDATYRPFLRCDSIKVKEYADRLIEEMVHSGKLPVDYKEEKISFLPRVEFHDRISLEFCRHLATSPDFKYTTNLRREMKNLDPIEEFLFHARAGHCERFASALALLLRSEGIPTVLVLGFKGQEPTDVPGKFLVREQNAHAWVAALIQQHDPTDKTFHRPLSRWRSLDPTPDGPPATDGVLVNGWAHPALSWLQRQFHNYISGYSSERRQRIIKEFVEQATRTETLAIALVIVLVSLLVRNLLRRQAKLLAPIATQPDWFIRLIDQLANCGLKQTPGETPFEFATRAATALRGNPTTAPVSDVPLDCVETYYETRFGNKEITPNRLAILEAGLQELVRVSGHLKWIQ